MMQHNALSTPPPGLMAQFEDTKFDVGDHRRDVRSLVLAINVDCDGTYFLVTNFDEKPTWVQMGTDGLYLFFGET